MVNSRTLEGDTIRLECKVDASPPPQLFWKKDKDMLRIDLNRMRCVSLSSDSTVQVMIPGIDSVIVTLWPVCVTLQSFSLFHCSLYQDGSGRQCLLIERVMKSDAGWYTLSAINEAGMSTCNARLDVGSKSVHFYMQMSSERPPQLSAA